MVSEKAMAELRGLVEKWQKYVDAHDGQYAYIEGVKLCLRELEDAIGKLSSARALEQPEGREAVADPEPPSNEVWPPDGAVWLAPVATDAPADPKLMQYAWGRSSLSSGQMAEAYQCIVSAAQECGQVYRLPVATPPESGGQGEECDGGKTASTGPGYRRECKCVKRNSIF